MHATPSFRQVALVLVALLLLALVPARAEEDPCLCRDITVRCEVRPEGPILVGEPFEFCATVLSEGNHPVENVRLRMDLCDGLTLLDGCQSEFTIPRLGPGESKTHCLRVMATCVGTCRNAAHAVDDTGIAAAGCFCDVAIVGLPALQLQMIDVDAQGQPQGIFRVGEEVVYELMVEEDEGSASANGLVVDWSLPPELEFVRGTGDRGTTVTGAGRRAESSLFSLGRGEVQHLQVVCRVLRPAPRGWVQTRAVVRTVDGGQELAFETESTTLRN